MDQRPTIDYVRAGDVIRGSVTINATLFQYGPDEEARLRNGLAAANLIVRGISFTTSQGPFWSLVGGPTIIEVQTLSDYSSINDVADVMAHAVYDAGYQVNWADTHAEFISKVEQTGVTPAPQIPSPYTYGSSPNATDQFSKFFENLTQSPISLAVLVGAAVLLVIAVKR